MNKIAGIVLLIFTLLSCSSQFNKGITDKKELRKKKPPSVRIAEDYDKKGKKYEQKTYKNPKRAAKARDKQGERHKKKGDKYLKKKRRKSR